MYENGLPEEFLEWVSQKKSQYLAEIIQLREESDIAFEEFFSIEVDFENALEKSEIVKEVTVERNQLELRRYYISEKNLWFFAIMTRYEGNMGRPSLVPIIWFVSKKDNWFELFSDITSLDIQTYH